ncbi:hypothetical protein HDU81_001129 [Chytriomyces hyalinus]|nr:hypothetical protein HDU81_001129 [Chytriomyces hyalinus]
MNTRKRSHVSYSTDESPINASKGRSRQTNEKSVQTLSISPTAKSQQTEEFNSFNLPVKASTDWQPQKCFPTELCGTCAETALSNLITPSVPSCLNATMEPLAENLNLDDVSDNLMKSDGSTIDSSKFHSDDQSPAASPEFLPNLAGTDASMAMVDFAIDPAVPAIELGQGDPDSGKDQPHSDLIVTRESANINALYVSTEVGTAKTELTENHEQDGPGDLIMGGQDDDSERDKINLDQSLPISPVDFRFNETVPESASPTTQTSILIPCVPTNSSLSENMEDLAANAKELALVIQILLL